MEPPWESQEAAGGDVGLPRKASRAAATRSKLPGDEVTAPRP